MCQSIFVHLKLDSYRIRELLYNRNRLLEVALFGGIEFKITLLKYIKNRAIALFLGDNESGNSDKQKSKQLNESHDFKFTVNILPVIDLQTKYNIYSDSSNKNYGLILGQQTQKMVN